MGRLITPLPRVGLTQGDRSNGIGDNAAERIVKYIPAEVVAFYLAALGIIETVPPENKARSGAYVVVFFAGLIAAPLYIAIVGRKLQAGKWLMIGWSIPAFTIWAYNLGGVFKLWGIHEPWIGSLLLLGVTLVAGLLPIPRV